MCASFQDCSTILSRCESEGRLRLAVKNALQAIGVDNFIYVTMLKHSRGKRNTHLQFGCDPRCCNIYSDMKLIGIDPYENYARNTSKPIMLDDLARSLQDSPDISHHMAALSRNGFHCGMVIPSHTSFSSRIGFLIVGNSREQEHKVFINNRMFLRALSLELLDWWIDQLQLKKIDVSSLQLQDFLILTYTHQGYKSNEISAIMGLKSEKVYNRNRVINEIFGTSSISDAAAIAIENGLITAEI